MSARSDLQGLLDDRDTDGWHETAPWTFWLMAQGALVAALIDAADAATMVYGQTPGRKIPSMEALGAAVELLVGDDAGRPEVTA